MTALKVRLYVSVYTLFMFLCVVMRVGAVIFNNYFAVSSTAIELNPNYVRAILRRAELYEKTDKLDEALEDYKTVLEKDPGIPAAREACMVSISV